MIYSLRGILTECDGSSAVVECAGVGYRLAVSAYTGNALPRRGGEVFLYTYLSLRDDGAELYGFSEKAELEMFRRLLSVSGVGPKVALAVLSRFRPDDLARLIATGDSRTLTGAPGVGAKTAQRIVLELKDKVAAVAFPGNVTSEGPADGLSGASEAVGALVSLGYSASDAAAAVAKLDMNESAEDLIKQALKLLAGRV